MIKTKNFMELTTFVLVTGGESGSADTARDPRGFAVKMYTEEGNWDCVGNNTPIFFIRDPLHVREALAVTLSLVRPPLGPVRVS